MKKLIIREACVGDQEHIVEFQKAMAFETEGLRLDPEVCRKGVASVFESSELGTYYIAENEGKVVASLLIIIEWSDWRNGRVWWIHSVYVVPSERGKGIFSKMFAFLKDKGSEEKIRGLRLYVDKTNTKAQEIYRRLGMRNDHYELYELMM